MFEEDYIEDAYEHICKSTTYREENDYIIDDDGNEVIDSRDGTIENSGVLAEISYVEENQEEPNEEDTIKTRAVSMLVGLRRKLDNELKLQEPSRHKMSLKKDDGTEVSVKVMAKSKKTKDRYIFLDLNLNKMTAIDLSHLIL